MTDKEKIPIITRKGLISVPERLKELDCSELFGVLATDDNGCPYASLVAFAITPDLKSVVFATPKKTRKYKNILNSGQVALLIDKRPETGKNLMKAEAVTLTGIARPVRRGKKRDEYARIFLNKHPDFERFVSSKTTAVITIDIAQSIHVSEFQTVTVWKR